MRLQSTISSALMFVGAGADIGLGAALGGSTEGLTLLITGVIMFSLATLQVATGKTNQRVTEKDIHRDIDDALRKAEASRRR